MNPALSVIFFTTLSGAGFGLLGWIGALLLRAPDPSPSVALRSLLLVGMALAAVGLLSSSFHLGKPLRAWRAFSQWRTSWLSREGVLSVAAFVPAVLLLFVSDAAMQRLLGALLIGLTLATVACTAMIYASLKPIPAWTHRLVLPVYLLFALQSGLALLALAAVWSDDTPAVVALAGTALLGVLLAAAKRRYWHAIDQQGLPASPGSAVGLPDRELRVFERPHTEANYITREMGFVLARRHGRRLRGLALLLFAAIPVALAPWAIAMPATQPWLAPPVLAAVLLGAFLERWLFFAQARHAVMAYY